MKVTARRQLSKDAIKGMSLRLQIVRETGNALIVLGNDGNEHVINLDNIPSDYMVSYKNRRAPLHTLLADDTIVTQYVEINPLTLSIVGLSD